MSTPEKQPKSEIDKTIQLIIKKGQAPRKLSEGESDLVQAQTEDGDSIPLEQIAQIATLAKPPRSIES